MKKSLFLLSTFMVCLCANVHAQENFYALRSTTLDGQEYSFEQLRGKYVLIVNTASACGYTKQYAGLQKLCEQYSDKLVVIGFPCNQFGAQEKGDGANSYFLHQKFWRYFSADAKIRCERQTAKRGVSMAYQQEQKYMEHRCSLVEFLQIPD